MIELEVTQHDIDTANVQWSPLDNAARRVFGRTVLCSWATLIHNFYNTKPIGRIAFCDVYYETKTEQYDFLGGDRAAQMMIDYQEGRPVVPTKFTLELTRTRIKRGFGEPRVTKKILSARKGM
jgi:hypothetical protein